ncbi:MAG: Tyrosyl-tRNA synthetase [Parcubacteria group bacterium GW2011_GWB1_35_5]|nr:MAG: Tyrosyl-tRNA synthetase [Parcubacteria group bacterium GW2011_GWB1_35_5]
MEHKLSKFNKIEELLSRGVEEVIDKAHLENKLKSGKQLRIKLGIDPTSPNIHLGRSIPLLKLRDFQKLGHKIIFIIGDFTGLIGDASDKDSERPILSEDTVNENLKTYIEQAAKIIDINTAEIYRNSEWLGGLGYLEIGRQADAFSLNEFSSRENIDRRMTEGKRVALREVFYPLMQGYDSVKVRADVEIGGTDQRFNLLTGRDMQRLYKQEPQDIVTNPIIEGLDGRKMSSSFGNSVNLFDTPDDMFGKIMSLKDEFIIKYFILLTRIDLKIINNYEESLKNGTNPRDIKMKLAHQIVVMYHNNEFANLAQSNWEKTFSDKKIPDVIQTIKVNKGVILVDVLVEHSLVKSKTDARRLFEEGAIKNLDDGSKINDSKIKVMEPLVLKIGKKTFIKISL